MKYGLKLALIGIGAFTAFFIATLPANMLIRSVAGNTPLAFDQVSGTIWRGRAGRVTGQGVSLGPVDWQVHPLQLFAGRLAATVNIRPDNTPAELTGTLEVSAGLTGTVTVTDTDLQADAEWVFAKAAVPVAANGDLSLRIDELRVERGQLPRVNAKARWSNAGVTYPREYDLGAYDIELRHQPAESPTHIVGHISDTDSPLHVNGDIQIQADGRFKLDIKVSTEPDAPQDIQRLLPLLGPKGPDGVVQLRRSGSIKQYL